MKQVPIVKYYIMLYILKEEDSQIYCRKSQTNQGKIEFYRDIQIFIFESQIFAKYRNVRTLRGKTIAGKRQIPQPHCGETDTGNQDCGTLAVDLSTSKNEVLRLTAKIPQCVAGCGENNNHCGILNFNQYFRRLRGKAGTATLIAGKTDEIHYVMSMDM